MNTKHQVHNLIILDESGSMYSIQQTIIQGFNEMVQTAKGIEKKFPDQEHFISLLSFNGLGLQLLHFMEPIANLQQIDDTRYQPDASTPLYDALGFGLTKLKKELAGKTDYHVLVTILTDGEENDSKEYTGKAIKTMIEELKNNHWTFTYIGTNHDVKRVAHSLSITNTLVFESNEADIKEMFTMEKDARYRYSEKIQLNEEIKENYYVDGKE